MIATHDPVDGTFRPRPLPGQGATMSALVAALLEGLAGRAHVGIPRPSTARRLVRRLHGRSLRSALGRPLSGNPSRIGAVASGTGRHRQAIYEDCRPRCAREAVKLGRSVCLTLPTPPVRGRARNRLSPGTTTADPTGILERVAEGSARGTLLPLTHGPGRVAGTTRGQERRNASRLRLRGARPIAAMGTSTSAGTDLTQRRREYASASLEERPRG